MFGLRTNECDFVFFQDLGKAGVFRKKPVAGMNGVRAGDLAGRDDRGDIEIAVFRGRRPDADALIGELDVHGLLVGGRIDGDRGDAQFLAARMTRSAISPRFAIRILSNIEGCSGSPSGH